MGQEGVTDHRQLIVWQKSLQFVKRIYTVTASFPRREIYGLSSQLRRAAVSVPSNISEGAARSGSKEFIKFLNVSRASLAEVETQILISNELGFIGDSARLMQDLKEIERMLNSLITSLRQRQ